MCIQLDSRISRAYVVLCAGTHISYHIMSKIRNNLRAPKRQRIDASGSHRDRVLFDGDYEVIHSRETHLTSVRRLPVETPRSPQKGRTSWIVGESWEPEDSTELGLDPTGDWCDEALEGPVIDVTPPTKKI
jgi:hypothetical protein